MSTSDVCILLSTYNGSRFISNQLDSILKQDYENWQMLIRDDCSDDDTVKILESYQARFPHRIKVITQPNINWGACKSFGYLLSLTDAKYILFCDQDDVWVENKITTLVEKIKILEEQSGKDTPILLHTDLVVGNEDLQIIHPSFWSYQNLNPNRGRHLEKILVQNVVTGCTMVINDALKRLALPFPNHALMHDWWLALVAVVFGKIDYISKPMVIYRQHGMNEVGAKRWGLQYIVSRLHDISNVRLSLKNCQLQADDFVSRFESQLPLQELQMSQAFASLNQMNFFQKRFEIFRYGFTKDGLLRNLGMLLWL